ncbi:MAG: GTPase ObgE [Actinobacteria bacterium]|nr:GTPase ObgE [Actinomycetota bacterium]MCB9389040.1 GTPase ObgE [Acidimicrobiia bacterium]
MSDFVDVVQLNVKGGDGGAGCVSFRREAHVPRGGPDGGNGGNGGDVVLRADRNTASLLAFRDYPHRRASSGTHGSGKKRNGGRGEDLVIDVPVGTVVRHREGDLIADLANDGDNVVVARGGQGGAGNARFLSNRRRAPEFAEQGEYGEEFWLVLELRLLADVALVGMPNAGKSTFIASVSAAKPKIANYPFTTLIPNLGVVQYHEHELVIADIPGLIEGAAAGRGLGHDFLRHVERARVLALLLDPTDVTGLDVDGQEALLLAELSAYKPELVSRPRIVVYTKSDSWAPELHQALASESDALGLAGGDREIAVAGPRTYEPARDIVAEVVTERTERLASTVNLSEQVAYDGFDELREIGPFPDELVPRLVISAPTRQGLDPVLSWMATLVDLVRSHEPKSDGVVVHRPEPKGFSVLRDDDGAWMVVGRSAERAVSLADLTKPDALTYVQQRLRDLGVDRALARAGVETGQEVRIGTFSFDYVAPGDLEEYWEDREL